MRYLIDNIGWFPHCCIVVLYCIVLYCIVLYCIILYCIVLYYIVLLYCIDVDEARGAAYPQGHDGPREGPKELHL
jgi:hypothetical protein